MRHGCQIKVLVCFSFFSFTAKANGSESVEYAHKLFERLTGVPLSSRDDRSATMAGLIEEGRLQEAAKIATEDQNFYSVTARNFAAPLTNLKELRLVPLNDAQATIIGTIRDDIDARGLLTGNYVYRGWDGIGLPEVEPDNNIHYQLIEERRIDLKRNLFRQVPQHLNMPEAAGILTTRGWASEMYDAGTNRRAVRFSIRAFLCTPITQWRDRGIIDYHVRRDVDRAPDGNPATYQSECRSCHAAMDAMAGAFSKLDFQNSRLLYSGDLFVAAKYNQNNHVYPEGFVTVDDSWINYATRNHNQAFGWRGSLRGKGVRAFGEMLANSEAFSKCMTERVFKEVCRRSFASDEDDLRSSLQEEFENSNYKLKNLFESVAIKEQCISHN